MAPSLSFSLLLLGAVSSAAALPQSGCSRAVPSPTPTTSQDPYAGPTATGAEPFLIQNGHPDRYPFVTAANPLETQTVVLEKKTEGFNPFRFMGTLSPYFSSPGFGLNTTPSVPPGCTLTEAHILHRHGARYPVRDDFLFGGLLSQLGNKSFTATGPLEFLKDWKYPLGKEILVPVGKQQEYDSGVAHRYLYGVLYEAMVKEGKIPVMRTTTQDRVYKSAINWIAGFFGVGESDGKYDLQVIIEHEGFNNTLAPGNVCPNSGGSNGSMGLTAVFIWANKYLADARKRLEGYLTGIKLSPIDVLGMQTLCPYETAAIGYSNFCDLWTEEEWRGYEYVHDLVFQGIYGFGSPSARAQGLGYVQELLARLTHTQPPNTSNSSINATLDSSPTTFPVDQKLYVDFTHDSVITSILTMLNLTQFADPLAPTGPPANQQYIASHVVPFGARLVTQVLSCPSGASGDGSVENVHNTMDSSYVRLILNDAVVPLTTIVSCPVDEHGRCPLSTFISSTQINANSIDFVHDCYGKYNATLNDGITDGRPKA